VTKLEVFVLSLLAGLVTLVFIGLAVLIIVPFEALPTMAPAPTVVAPIILLNPTQPSLLPTAVEVSATDLVEPSPTNTRVPTVTPLPVKTATPIIAINIPTPIILPSDTPTLMPRPMATSTSVPMPTATRFIPLGYQITFSAEKMEVEKSKCTNLRWVVEGASTVTLDGDTVELSGKKKVCPDRNKTYRLEVTLPHEFVVETREVKIKIVSPVSPIEDPD